MTITPTTKKTIAYLENKYSRKIDRDDVRSICYLSLLDGTKKWDKDKSNFETYISMKMNGSIRNEVKRLNGQKYVGTTISIHDDDNFNPVFLSVEANQETKVAFNEYINKLLQRLSSIESRVFCYLIDGYNATEISEKIGVTTWAVCLIKKRIYLEFKKILNIERMQIEALA